MTNKVADTYTPSPIDTADVQLPDNLMELVELMARNVHEVWAATRISQGWMFGPTRDDVRKQHPCLVPYDELPEEEKDYDRKTSLETLKMIVKLGFKLTR